MRVLIGAAGLGLATWFAVAHGPTPESYARDRQAGELTEHVAAYQAAHPVGDAEPLTFGTDKVFTEVNPYSCVRRVKGVDGPAALRRAYLAACLRRVSDPMQALRALDAGGFDVPDVARREIESNVNRGRRVEAQERVAALVNPAPPGR